jgi:hypothetical protein
VECIGYCNRFFKDDELIFSEDVILKIDEYFKFLSNEVRKLGDDNPLFDGFPTLKFTNSETINCEKKRLIKARNALNSLLEVCKKNPSAASEITEQAVAFYRTLKIFQFEDIGYNYNQKVSLLNNLAATFVTQDQKADQNISFTELIFIFNKLQNFDAILALVVDIRAIEDDNFREAAKDLMLVCLLPKPNNSNNVDIISEMIANYAEANRSADESAFDGKAWIENYKASGDNAFDEPLCNLFIALINLHRNRERIARLANSANVTGDDGQEVQNLRKQIDDTLANVRKKAIIKNDGETKDLLSNFYANPKIVQDKVDAIEAKKRTSKVEGLLQEWKNAEIAYETAQKQKDYQQLRDDANKKYRAYKEAQGDESKEVNTLRSVWHEACTVRDAKIEIEFQTLESAKEAWNDAIKPEFDELKNEETNHRKCVQRIFDIFEENLEGRKTAVLEANKKLTDFLKKHSASIRP